MTDADYGTFERAFRRLSGAFRLRLRPSEAEDLTKTYFRNLKEYPLDEVLLAAQTCLTTLRTFPKVADWIEARSTNSSPKSGTRDVRQMSVSEMEEQAQAAALHWEGQPCLCTACVRADVDHQPLRYVPTLVDGLTEDRAFNPRRNQVEVVGHWAHGEELRRWYEARDHFYALWKRAAVRYPHLVGRGLAFEREPGEEG